MPEWSFLTNHARVLVCIAADPGVRLRDIATTLAVTERTAYGIVTDLTTAGYVVKDKDGRRNRYQIQVHLPVRGAATNERTIGEVLELLLDTNTRGQGLQEGTQEAHGGGLDGHAHAIADPTTSGDERRGRSGLK
jgi:Winged helix DNA-binding domain